MCCVWRLRIANLCLPRYVCVQHPALTLEARSRPAWPSIKWTMMLLSVVHNVRQIDASMETVIILVQFAQDVDCWYKTHVKFRTLMPCLRKPCCRGDCALVRPEAGNSGRPRHWPPIHQFWKLNTLLEFFVHLPERLWVYIECTVPAAAVAALLTTYRRVKRAYSLPSDWRDANVVARWVLHRCPRRRRRRASRASVEDKL